jgi:tyrosine-protein phosphatase SIW14
MGGNTGGAPRRRVGARRAADVHRAWFNSPSLLTAVALCIAIGAAPSAQSTSPERPRETDSQAAAAAAARRKGLPNFGVVGSQLSRGAQPEDAAFAELKTLGVDLVVSFRHDADQIARERLQVEAHHMRFVSIPWRGKDQPRTEHVAEFLRVLRDNPERKVFVHCKRGAERTGVMVAAYRISRDGWTPEQALAEMKAFRFRSRFRHLAQFVHQLPTLLLRDPHLRSTTGQ